MQLLAEDGGQSWKREKAADELAANLYELVFTPAGLGFVLGNDGVLLRVGPWRVRLWKGSAVLLRVGLVSFPHVSLMCRRLRRLRQRLLLSGLMRLWSPALWLLPG